MADFVDKNTRSRMMARVGGKNTKPEMMIRQGLHRMGFRYRLHDKGLPGKPDIIFPKYGALININGCYWHQHDCHLFSWPSTRREFWRKKIGETRRRDERNLMIYAELGWKVLVIWECALKGKTRRPASEVLMTAANWLQFDSGNAKIMGRRSDDQ